MPPAPMEPPFEHDPYSAHQYARDSQQLHHHPPHHHHHGSHRHGFPGHVPPQQQQQQQPLWHARPGSMPGIGAKFGRRATWIGASSDQTFLKVDESLINAHTLPHAAVFANATSIGLVPPPCGAADDYFGGGGRFIGGGSAGNGVVRGLAEDGVKCLMISRLDGSCKSFCENDGQWDLARQSCYLDPIYDILWAYHPQTQMISCFNVVVTETPALVNGASFSLRKGAVEARMRHKALTSSLAQVRVLAISIVDSTSVLVTRGTLTVIAHLPYNITFPPPLRAPWASTFTLRWQFLLTVDLPSLALTPPSICWQLWTRSTWPTISTSK